MTETEIDEIEKRVGSITGIAPTYIIYVLKHDIPALIAEVRRLKEQLRNASDEHILGAYCDRCGYGNRGDE